MGNPYNKCELIYLLSLTFWKYQITLVQFNNDADTSVVRVTLADATNDFVVISTFLLILQVQAKDFADNAGAS